MAVELGDWLRANSGAQVNINVPPEVLGRGGMLYAAERAGLADLFPQIVLEVTERGLPDLLGVETLNRVKDFGLRVALDDVALVGGASVAVLARADLDVIKIDKSLVSELEPDRPYPDWPNEIAALVSSSRVVVIAEGVETERQLLALREAGIKLRKGSTSHGRFPLPVSWHIIAKPMALVRIERRNRAGRHGDSPRHE